MPAADPLSGFLDAFESGYSMVSEAKERKERRKLRALQTEQLEEELGEWRETKPLRMEGMKLGIEATRGDIERAAAGERRAGEVHAEEYGPAGLERRRRREAADLAATQATTAGAVGGEQRAAQTQAEIMNPEAVELRLRTLREGVRTAETAGEKAALELEEQRFLQELRSGFREEAEGAEDESVEDEGEDEAPGPQSALPVGAGPGVQLASYTPPESALPTETDLREPEGGRIKELTQGKIRDKPIAASTRGYLDYAAAQNGVIVEVTSGGQPAKGKRTGSTRHNHGNAADVRLRDQETGELLSMRNPQDRERMLSFAADAKAAGATGIGAGENYMGQYTMHIGGGTETYWGDADWIAEAHAEGLRRRKEGKTRGIGGGEAEGEAALAYAGPESAAAQSPGQQAIEDMDRDDAIDVGREAAKVGLLALAADVGPAPAVDDPGYDQRVGRYVLGEGAADPQDVQAVQDIAETAVNHKGKGVKTGKKKSKMSAAERAMSGLAVTYQYYLAIGEPEKAETVAKAITQSYRMKSSQWLALSQAAAEGGNLSDSVEALAKSYAFIPNGRDLKLTPTEDGNISISATDMKTGKTIFKEIIPPREYFAGLMKLGPHNFDEEMLRAAGETPKVKEGTPLTEGAIAALTKADPDLANTKTVEEANVVIRAKGLDRRGGRGGGRGGGKPPTSFQKYYEGDEDQGTSGFATTMDTLLDAEREDPNTGATAPGSSLRANVIANAGDEAAGTAELEKFKREAGRVAHKVHQNGYTGDDLVLAEMITAYTTQPDPAQAGIAFDPEQNAIIYQGREVIPINENIFNNLEVLRKENMDLAKLTAGQARREESLAIGERIQDERQANPLPVPPPAPLSPVREAIPTGRAGQPMALPEWLRMNPNARGRTGQPMY